MSCLECLTERAIPAVVTSGYQPKGDFETIDGLKTYVTGNKGASSAVIFTYDAFGYSNQTLQGADMLAAGIPSLVFMPDVLYGGLPSDTLPPDTPVKKARLEEFMAAHPMDYSDPAVIQVDTLSKTIARDYPSVKKIGAFGLCFGGKVSILASNLTGSTLVASGQGHPGRLSAEDAKQLKIPHLVLASKDEASVVGAFDEVEKPAGSVTHSFDTMPHGWMGHRANLEDKEFETEYDKAYNMTAHWFKKHLL